MIDLSRRRVLQTAAAAGTLPALPRIAAATTPPAKRLVADYRILDVKGKAAKMFRLTGPDGKAGIFLAPNERFRVDLVNRTTTSTIIHWHGQLPPWTQDGFPWPQTPPIAAGATHAYDYAPISGTFWMHSHQGMQEQSLMTAPLIVHSATELREDRQEIVLMLHDFSFRAPDELLAGLTGQTTASIHAMVRQAENVAAPESSGNMLGRSRDMRGMKMESGSSMGGMMMKPGDNAGGTAMGGMGGMPMDLNDIDYDAYLANERTLADPEIVRVQPRGRVMLRIINGSSSSKFWIDLGVLTGKIVAVDGHAVRPVPGRRFPIAIAQRLDILIDLPDSGAFPVLARLEGSRRRTGVVLATKGARIVRIDEKGLDQAQPVDNSLETQLSAMRPLVSRKADLMHRIVLSGGMKPYVWGLNDQYWPHIEPLMLTKGQRVEIEIVNRSMMPHPMHLHGHAFQVVALDGKPIAGAVRDTVLVPGRMGSSVRIAFDADNPGRWAFHCHNLYHMMAGMMTEFRYQSIAV